MSFDPLSAAFDLGKVAIEKIWPDPTKRAQEMRLLEELHQKGDLAALEAHVQLMLAQIKVNETASQHKSVFVAGARPFIIWVGGVSLLWSGLLHPILLWVWAFAEMPGEAPPMIDSGAIVGIVSGLLGVAGMRSYDKGNGTQTDSIS